MLAVGDAENFRDLIFTDFLARKTNDLIEQTERIAHTARGLASDELECGFVGVDGFVFAEVFEVLDDIALDDAFEVETLATTQNRDRYLLRFGGREDEHDVRRRLFQDFEQRVERLRG